MHACVHTYTHTYKNISTISAAIHLGATVLQYKVYNAHKARTQAGPRRGGARERLAEWLLAKDADAMTSQEHAVAMRTAEEGLRHRGDNWRQLRWNVTTAHIQPLH